MVVIFRLKSVAVLETMSGTGGASGVDHRAGDCAVSGHFRYPDKRNSSPLQSAVERCLSIDE